jgi:hypothetical protein
MPMPKMDAATCLSTKNFVFDIVTFTRLPKWLETRSHDDLWDTIQVTFWSKNSKGTFESNILQYQSFTQDQMLNVDVCLSLGHAKESYETKEQWLFIESSYIV